MRLTQDTASEMDELKEAIRNHPDLTTDPALLDYIESEVQFWCSQKQIDLSTLGASVSALQGIMEDGADIQQLCEVIELSHIESLDVKMAHVYYSTLLTQLKECQEEPIRSVDEPKLLIEKNRLMTDDLKNLCKEIRNEIKSLIKQTESEFVLSEWQKKAFYNCNLVQNSLRETLDHNDVLVSAIISALQCFMFVLDKERLVLLNIYSLAQSLLEESQASSEQLSTHESLIEQHQNQHYCHSNDLTDCRDPVLRQLRELCDSRLPNLSHAISNQGMVSTFKLLDTFVQEKTTFNGLKAQFAAKLDRLLENTGLK